ncbi:hypothetical protein [Rhodocyclus purpureus]|uniref:hypothetical protein n=1 Tax=Rhodocyclus purpureus TaxID=1067 RepID=UPI00191408C9|nr:hypothetical protein [Rhodocyclus purpureus]
MHLKAKVTAGTTVQHVADAFKVLMEYSGHDGVDAFSSRVMGEDEFFYDPQMGDLAVSTYGEVRYGYADLVREFACNLGRIVVEPGEIWLYDHDTGDIDEAKTVIEFGPSEEAIKAYIATREIEAGLKLMEPYLSHEKLAALRPWLALEAQPLGMVLDADHATQ